MVIKLLRNRTNEVEVGVCGWEIERDWLLASHNLQAET